MLVEKKIILYTQIFCGRETGLGLLLGYDIVKAHGEIKVETKKARPDEPVGRGEGGVFIIQLPTR